MGTALLSKVKNYGLQKYSGYNFDCTCIKVQRRLRNMFICIPRTPRSLLAYVIILCLITIAHYLINSGGNFALSTRNDAGVKEIHSLLSKKTDKILVLAYQAPRNTEKFIISLLETFHLEYSVMLKLDRNDFLVNTFSLVIVSDLSFLQEMSSEDFSFLTAYCKNHTAGMIIFSQLTKETNISLSNLKQQINITSFDNINSYELSDVPKFLNLTKAGGKLENGLPASKETIASYVFNDKYYQPLAYATKSGDSSQKKYVTSLVDSGNLDGVEKVYFGYGLDFWLHSYLFLDAMHYLSKGAIKTPFTRYIAIDIDDVFRGSDMPDHVMEDDTKNIVEVAKKLETMVKGLCFGMLFCANSFVNQLKNAHEEDKATLVLMEQKDMFRWYDHTYSHINVTSDEYVTRPNDITEEMQKNRDWAKKYGLPVVVDYMVTKAHGGIFPPVDIIYDTLMKMGMKVTGTDRYIIPLPYGTQRLGGFVYKGVYVIPRIELSGLGALEVMYADHEGGKKAFIDREYRFLEQILFTQAAIYFVHYINLRGDRLAAQAVQFGIESVQQWTNLKLVAMDPVELAEIHFKIYPEDRIPIWQNPCNRDFYRKLWDSTKSCDTFPRILFVGPTHTGAPILSWLLDFHPLVNGSKDLYFLDKDYTKGIDWYHSQYVEDKNSKEKTVNYDMTQTYFQSGEAPKRAKFMMLDGFVIITMVNPMKRAFNVFQDVKDGIPDTYTFYDVISSTNNAPEKIREIKDKVLPTGKYMDYIPEWTKYFDPDHLIFIDGEELIDSPRLIADKMQTALKLSSKTDYASVTSDQKKNEICASGLTSRCIAVPVYRKDEDFSEKENTFLSNYYKKSNADLKVFFQRRGVRLPNWLY